MLRLGHARVAKYQVHEATAVATSAKHRTAPSRERNLVAVRTHHAFSFSRELRREKEGGRRGEGGGAGGGGGIARTGAETRVTDFWSRHFFRTFS